MPTPAASLLNWGYLKHVEKVAKRNGAVVILDEVLMGFRTSFGLAGQAVGVDADLATVGKAIGSGIAVAGVVGTSQIMALCESGTVARAGTYSGNPIATAAVSATLELLADHDYKSFVTRGDRLRGEIEQIFAANGIAAKTSGYGSVFTVWFADDVPQTYLEATLKLDEARSNALHLALRRAGLLVMPSPYGRMYLSAAHDDNIIDEMADMFRIAVTSLR